MSLPNHLSIPKHLFFKIKKDSSLIEINIILLNSNKIYLFINGGNIDILFLSWESINCWRFYNYKIIYQGMQY